MFAKMHGRPESQSKRTAIAEKTIRDVDRILEVRHPQPFLHRAAMNVEPPYGQACLEAELTQKFSRMQIEVFLRYFFSTEIQDGVFGQRNLLGEMTQHHHASQWSRQ